MAWKKPPSQVYYIGCLFYTSFLLHVPTQRNYRKQYFVYLNHREWFSDCPWVAICE